jgi:hypothetical protein
MNGLHQAKFAQVIAPAAIVDNASFTTVEVDTLDYDYATFIFNLGATDVAMTALKIQESDTSGSGFADISGTDLSSATDIDGSATALPSATDDGNVIVIQVNLKGKKRYLDMVATAGNGSTGTYGSAVCVLSKGAIAPESVADTGCETLVRV